jgi:antagonist of KipI
MIIVVDPGPLASVQDPFGRPGWRRYGVPVGGAADALSARLANRLAGNDENAALVEVSLGGAAFRIESAGIVALTGGLPATIDGAPAPAAGVRVRAGSLVRLEAGDGVRGYLAIAGGLVVEHVLGSASTELRARFGGHEGRALRSGDRLTIGTAPARPPLRWAGEPRIGPIRVVGGPHPEALAQLVARAWTVAVEADRTGVRLDGDRIGGSGEVASMGLPIGAIQVPPDGRPIVMLADRPVTGGYPVPACVIRADVGRLAQLHPGDEVSFALVSPDDAREAWRAAEASLSQLEPIDDPAGDLGWIGSHD